MTKAQILIVSTILTCVLLSIGKAQNEAANQNGRKVRSAIHSIAHKDLIENSPTQPNVSNMENGVWVLIPKNLSESQLSRTDFNLFKLNTDQLLGGTGIEGSTSSFLDEEKEDQSERYNPAQPSSHEFGMKVSRRESRKLKLFPNFMRKPKVSPLYLVNGTVCRFVNTQPICTTLSTTGLFGGNNRPSFNSSNNNNSGGPFQQGQQGQQQFQNQFQQGGQQRQTSPINQQG